MKKVKEFIEEHKMEIAGIIACGVSCGIGAYVGYSYCMRHNTVLDDGIVKRVLDDAIKRYNNWMSAYGVYIDDGYNSTELGKIGEKMMKVGVPSDKVFTHFIAIGKPENK